MSHGFTLVEKAEVQRVAQVERAHPEDTQALGLLVHRSPLRPPRGVISPLPLLFSVLVWQHH